MHKILPSRQAMILARAMGLGLLLAATPWTVTLQVPTAQSDVLATEEQAVPLNAAQATDAPDDIDGEAVITASGKTVGHVGETRMETRAGLFRVAEVRIDPPEPAPSWWVDGDRVMRLPFAVQIIAANPQTAERFGQDF